MYFLSGALAALLFCGAEPFMLFRKMSLMRNNSVELFEFEPGVQEEMSLKDISYLELW